MNEAVFVSSGRGLYLPTSSSSKVVISLSKHSRTDSRHRVVSEIKLYQNEFPFNQKFSMQKHKCDCKPLTRLFVWAFFSFFFYVRGRLWKKGLLKTSFLYATWTWCCVQLSIITRTAVSLRITHAIYIECGRVCAITAHLPTSLLIRCWKHRVWGKMFIAHETGLIMKMVNKIRQDIFEMLTNKFRYTLILYNSSLLLQISIHSH